VNITISARRLTMLFAGMVGLLILIHTILQVIRFMTGDHSLMGLLAISSLGADVAVPSFYSAIAILFCSFLLAIIAMGEFRRRGYRAGYWLALSAIFLFLSIDEMLSIHERLIPLLRPAFEGYGALYYGWVAPYAAAVVVLFVAYARFLLGLPRLTAWLFLLSGGLYVGGAVGFEIIGGYVAMENGTMNVPYVIVQSIEEILEMTGIVIFIYTLASYAEQRFGGISIQLSATPGAVEVAERQSVKAEPAGLTSRAREAAPQHLQKAHRM
jgi:hypothetical protein